MNEQDMKSFNEWHRDNRIFPNDNETASGYANRYAKEAWQAALEYERKSYTGMSLNRATIDYNTIRENLEMADACHAKEIQELEEKLAETEKWKDIYGSASEDRLEKLSIAIKALEKLANDKSPRWDNLDWKREAREALEKLKG